MDFGLTDEETALVEALRQHLSRVCPHERLRAWEADGVSADDAFVRTMADNGFLEVGLSFGLCAPFSPLILLEQEAGRFLAPPFLSWQTAYAAYLLEEHPLGRQIAAGRLVAPFVPNRGRVEVVSGPGGPRLHGWGEGVLFLDLAELLLAVVDMPAGPAVACFSKDAPGVSARPVSMQSGTPRWRVDLDGASVHELVLVTAAQVDRARDRLRACLAAWSVGAGRQAIELAVAYAGERQAFGHPIGSYQSVQNRLVDPSILLEEAWMLACRAAALIDAAPSGERTADTPAADAAAMAWQLAGQAFTQASRAAMATFGGYGFTVDFDIQLFFRRAKEQQLSFEPRSPWEDGAPPLPAFRADAATASR